MTYTPYVYLYGGSTCEDVYAEEDDWRNSINLEVMSSPQCAFVALEYSEELIEALARDMWDEIKEFYNDPDEPDLFGVDFETLRVVTSSKVCEPPEGHEGEELPVKEVTVLDYYLHQTVEPLMKIVVQVRPVRRPSKRARTLAELLPDFGAAPGDNGNHKE